jgi:tryptophan 2,3-dioxygenase
MTQRMIGSKIGTGGSSGYWYLKATLERGKIFADIANMATFMLPRRLLPKLPQSVKANLGFYHEVLTQKKD